MMTPDQGAAGALDNATDTSGADAQASATEKPQEGGMQGSFFIPKDLIGGKQYKPGETLSLEVVGHDEDGDLEVKCCGGEGESEGGDWRNELRGAIAQHEGA